LAPIGQNRFLLTCEWDVDGGAFVVAVIPDLVSSFSLKLRPFCALLSDRFVTMLNLKGPYFLFVACNGSTKFQQVKPQGFLYAFEESADCALLSPLCEDSNLHISAHKYVLPTTGVSKESILDFI